jgi:rhodanese-related sulfurtransferase
MSTQQLVKEICPTTTQEWVKNGALLVDVREQNEIEALSYDVPNILHVPLSEFEDRFTEIPKDKDVVMVCRSGGRSLRAAGFLVNHGYDKVVNMQHGMIRWAEKGFSTKGDTSSLMGNSSGSCCTPAPEKKENSGCCSPSSSSDTSSKCC